MILVYAFLVLVASQSGIGEVTKIEIDGSSDAQMLPFAAEILWQEPLPERTGSLHHPVRVMTPSTDSVTPALLFMGFNIIIPTGDPSMLKVSRWPGLTIVDENPARLVLSDISILSTPDTVPTTVFGTGVRNDSGFYFLYRPLSEYYREQFLVAGADSTGDGRWAGRLVIVETVDLNGDGFDEVLLFVSASRDGRPRELLCIDPVSAACLWRVSVVSLVKPTGGFFVRSQEPRLLLVTSCPGQGYRDSLFTDSYSYFVAMTSNGEIATKKIVARYSEPAELLYDSLADRMYLYHTFAPTEDTLTADTAAAIPRLSVIDSDCRIIASSVLPDQINPLWLYDYSAGGDREIYTLSPDGTVRIYGSSLQLLAESSQSTLGGFIGLGPPLRDYPVTFVIRDKRRFATLFSPSFERLAVLPDMGYFEIVDRQPDTDSPVIASSLPAVDITIVKLRPRSLLEYVAVLFQRYRIYILAVLCSLLVGLVVVNFYRVRTRRNLHIISEQKSEIERTHEALKDAQQKIIEAEKYRQAQDIAGGFAHEIRNALLPAQVAHQKLFTRQPQEAGTIERAEHAVRRALDLTDAISRYTRLESVEHAESVVLGQSLRAVHNDLRSRIEESGISLMVEGDETLRVHADPEHVRMLFSNLLTNAIDALANQPVKTITVTLRQEVGTAVVTVADTGAGIDPAILPRMFEPFVSSKPREGHGLGLSLVSRIVGLYGGSVRGSIRSAGGAEISFSIPVEEHA